MKHILIIISSLALLTAPLSAQVLQQEEDSRRGKFYLVPETSFWFGRYTTVDVTPMIGYHLTDRWSMGPGLHYTYYRNIDYYSPERWDTHIFGIKGFTRLDLFRNAQEFLPIYLFNDLFIHAEYEAMSLERRYFDAPSFPEDGRFWINNVFIGLGITQRTAGFNGYSIMLLWNLNDSFYSPYSNPTYRVGLTLYL